MASGFNGFMTLKGELRTTGWGPSSLAKLVYTTITIVYDIYNYI